MLTKLTVRNVQALGRSRDRTRQSRRFRRTQRLGHDVRLASIADCGFYGLRAVDRATWDSASSPPQRWRCGPLNQRCHLVTSAAPLPTVRQLWRELALRSEPVGPPPVSIKSPAASVSRSSSTATTSARCMNASDAMSAAVMMTQPAEQAGSSPAVPDQPAVRWSCGLEFDFGTSGSDFHRRPLRQQPDLRTPNAGSDSHLLRHRALAMLGSMSGQSQRMSAVLDDRRCQCSGQRGPGYSRTCCDSLGYENLLGPGRRDAVANILPIASISSSARDSTRLAASPSAVRSFLEVTAPVTGRCLDLTSAGRGMQQTLLLLAFLELNRPATRSAARRTRRIDLAIRW